ncbi:MAG: efflux RND transporter permease subunit [Spirochaetaceae bacterium]
MPGKKTAVSGLLLPILTAAAFTAASLLSQSYYPAPPKPVLTVISEYRQASAKEVDRRISVPIERAAAVLPGASSTYSVSTQGKSSVYVVFELGISGETAALRLRRALSDLLPELPSAVSGPSVYEGGEESLPVWAVAFPEDSRREAEEFAEKAEMLSPRLRVSGPPEIRRGYEVRMDTLTAAGAGVTQTSLLSGFSDLLQSAHYEFSRGSILYSGGGLDSLLSGSTYGTTVSAEETSSLLLSKKSKTSIERIDGAPSLFVWIYNEGGEHTVRLCGLLEKLRRTYPHSRTVLNRGSSIGGILGEIFLSVGAGIVLVCILLSRNSGFSSTFSLLISIPLALLGAAAALKAADTSLNMMTLSGAAVSIGLCVDTSVLAYEFTRIHGFRAFKSRVFSPILLSTLTTGAVFFPLPFFPPEIRVQFAGFAGVIIPALSVSTLYTLYGLPRLLPGSEDPLHRTLYRHISIKKVLRRTHLFRRFRVPTAFTLLLLTSGAVLLFGSLSFSPYPDIPEPSVHLRYEFPQGTVAEAVDAALRPVEEYMNSVAKEVRVSVTRERGTLTITPHSPQGKEDILAAAKGYFKRPGFGGSLFVSSKERRETSVPLYFFAADFPSAAANAQEAARKIGRSLPESDISFHFKDPMHLYRIGIYPGGPFPSPAAPLSSGSELFWALSETPFEKAILHSMEYDLTLKADLFGGPPRSLAALSSSLASAAETSLPPMDTFLRIRKESSHGTFYRRDTLPSAGITLHTDTLSRKEAGGVLQDFFPDALIDPDFEEELLLGRNIFLFLCAALVVIAILLYGYFGRVLSTAAAVLQIPLSYILPVYILSLLGLELSIPTLAGFLLLAGVSVNNGIVLFGGSGREDAVLRLADKERPLMLSALTTAAGVLPTAFTGFSSGGVLAPLSLVIASGTFGSYLLLYVQTGLISGFNDRVQAFR